LVAMAMLSSALDARHLPSTSCRCVSSTMTASLVACDGDCEEAVV
jgi:hypothetical protein